MFQLEGDTPVILASIHGMFILRGKRASYCIYSYYFAVCGNNDKRRDLKFYRGENILKFSLQKG